ncbi:MAG: DUF2160 domain-containing protein [Pseudohongiellaceae bacterium]
MNWMAWTPLTAVFFAVIAVILLSMTVAEVRWPSTERKGLLLISTTRGDRLFIGLLSSAFFHLAVLGLSDWPLYIATVLCVIWVLVLLRWA